MKNSQRSSNFEKRWRVGGPPYIKRDAEQIPTFSGNRLDRDKMQSAARIILSLFVVTTVVGAYHSSAKLRRDGVLNLYPFPRVGRSGPRSWKIPINDIYLDSESASKRQLYAFPRVGRGPHSPRLELTPLSLEELLLKARARSHGFVKRESESDPDSGMWFGPRLGRGFRNDDVEASETSEQEKVDPELSDSEETQAKQT